LTSCFIDTNLFIRYFTNDDPAKADRVGLLLKEAASGSVALVTTEMVIAEIVWVLESYYSLDKAAIAPIILGILATPGLTVLNGSLVARALEMYESSRIDFIDGYIVAVMEKQGITDLYSYDRKHISCLKQIRRREP